MKVLVQNVISASVSVNNEIIGQIDKGMLLFVGFSNFDNIDIIQKMALKISKIRIFSDKNGKTNLSLTDIKGEILSISQFTLYGSLKKGNRPSFIDSLEPIKAKQYYELFNDELKKLGFKVNTGLFGADMKVSLINNGPFTILLDSEELFK